MNAKVAESSHILADAFWSHLRHLVSVDADLDAVAQEEEDDDGDERDGGPNRLPLLAPQSH